LFCLLLLCYEIGGEMPTEVKVEVAIGVAGGVIICIQRDSAWISKTTILYHWNIFGMLRIVFWYSSTLNCFESSVWFD